MDAALDWDLAWFDGQVARRSMLAWRGVEAQHVVSTMRLVDTPAEQHELEVLLERSKPAHPAPGPAPGTHYLLSTPFRYRPGQGSRFRRAGTLGIWYGAEDLETACAEVAWWRHRFLLDSEAFAQAELLTEHTFFQARIDGTAIDLTSPPWLSARAAWTHGSDYRNTQAVADAARERKVQWICFESARAPGHRCAAVLALAALGMPAQGNCAQTWHCKTTRASVMLVRGSQRLAWSFPSAG